MNIKRRRHVTTTQAYIIRMSVIGGLLACIASLLQLSAISWLWSAITIYMVMDTRHGLTLRGGFNRLLSAATGSTLGYFCAVIFVCHNWLSISLGMMTIGIIGGALSFAYPSLKLLCMNACVVLIMSKVPTLDLPIWKIAFERTANNALGIGLVFLTSFSLYTRYSFDAAKVKLTEIQTLNQRYLQHVFDRLSEPSAKLDTNYPQSYQRLTLQLKALLLEIPYEQGNFSYRELKALQHWLGWQECIMQALTTTHLGLSASSDNRLLECFSSHFQALCLELQHINALGEHWLAESDITLEPQPLQASWLTFQHSVDQTRQNPGFQSYSMEAIARFYMAYSLFETLGQLSIKPSTPIKA